MLQNEHIPDTILIDYALAEEFDVPEDQAKAVREHIAECETCRKRYALYVARYHDFAEVCSPVKHFDKLRAVTVKQKRKTKAFYWSAAAALLIALSYGMTARYMNVQFDNGETGLAAFYEDYRYAKIPVTFRDNQTVETSDSKLFREAVLTLFEAKTTMLGLFPDYDFKKVQQAEQLFSRAEAETVNPVLKKKIREYKDKIRLIFTKKEIKK